jgi:phospholipase/lecithinase/hemolysin
MFRSILALCFAAIVIAVPSPGLALPFTNLYVLGDSLADQGNLLIATSAATGGTVQLPDPLHYFDGRFTNRPTQPGQAAVYTDGLAGALGVPLTPSLLGGNNFAFGGARTSYNRVELGHGGGFPPALFPWSLNGQIQAFSDRNVFDPGGLYVVFAGSNDVADIIVGANLISGIAETVAAIVAAIDEFRQAGAQTILVPNVPDFGLTPPFLGAASAFATAISMQFNQALQEALDQIIGVDIVQFDTFELLRGIVADPGRFGLTNTTMPCYTGFVEPDPTATECVNPDEYLFWDLLHPTVATHGILANAMLAALAVPEPATAPLLVVGFLILAFFAARRRRS